MHVVLIGYYLTTVGIYMRPPPKFLEYPPRQPQCIGSLHHPVPHLCPWLPFHLGPSLFFPQRGGRSELSNGGMLSLDSRSLAGRLLTQLTLCSWGNGPYEANSASFIEIVLCLLCWQLQFGWGNMPGYLFGGAVLAAEVAKEGVLSLNACVRLSVHSGWRKGGIISAGKPADQLLAPLY